MTIHVFVGYDSREHAAWLVCRKSLLAYGQDIEVHSLYHRDLRQSGWFDRPWRIDEKGQMWDERDRQPFSTEFSHSRFLTPALARSMGLHTGYALFVDCDFMFLRPVQELIDGIEPDKAVSVVKHDFAQKQQGVKMDGMIQARYPRKLWSSLMVFNLADPRIDRFCRSAVNSDSGRDLHNFLGLDDYCIGSLPEAWNFIPGHSNPAINPAAIHWSLGGPWFTAYADTSYGDLWRDRLATVLTQDSQMQDWISPSPTPWTAYSPS